MSRIDDKIIEIEKYLEELYEFFPGTFEEYKSNFISKAASERYFEIIIESIIDLAFLVIKEKKLDIPESDKDALCVLETAKIIPAELSSRLQDAKSMRNFIAHQYGRVDDKIVFDSILEQLNDDIQQFIKLINKNL